MTTLVVDGNNVACRAWFAAGQQPAMAMTYFRTWLSDCRNQWPSRRRVLAFDPVESSFRKALYPAYKAGREPDILRENFILNCMTDSTWGWRLCCPGGFEADDAIASIAHWSGGKVVVVSNDKDLLQLVGERVVVVSPTSGMGGARVYDTEAVVAKMGVFPRRVPDLKALAGDPSDNIPGLPKIGPKRAIDLIECYGGVTQMLALPATQDRVIDRSLTTVWDNADRARLYLQLTTLRTDAPIGDVLL